MNSSFAIIITLFEVLYW